MLEFPSHICASCEDTEIINLIKDFFEETMCLYNIIELEQLFDSLTVKTHSKENFEVIVDCQDASTLEKLKSVSFINATFILASVDILSVAVKFIVNV